MKKKLRIILNVFSVLSVINTLFLIICGIEMIGTFLMFPIFVAFIGPELDLNFELLMHRIMILGIGYSFIIFYIYLNVRFFKNIAIPYFRKKVV